uniref:Uncharacterized protein n=1 Tax=Anguilla anguilla TaxID=7936 RepID=A0A0E9QF38_ANGAN
MIMVYLAHIFNNKRQKVRGMGLHEESSGCVTKQPQRSFKGWKVHEESEVL